MYIAFKEELDKLARKTELIDFYKIANDLGMLLLKKREYLPKMLQKSVVFSSLYHCAQHSFEFFEIGHGTIRFSGRNLDAYTHVLAFLADKFLRRKSLKIYSINSCLKLQHPIEPLTPGGS